MGAVPARIVWPPGRNPTSVVEECFFTELLSVGAAPRSVIRLVRLKISAAAFEYIDTGKIEWEVAHQVQGTEIILFFRNLASPQLDAVFGAITMLGSETFYMIIIPIVFWCISKTVGLHLGLVSTISLFLNGFLKNLFQVPRPFVAHPEIAEKAAFIQTAGGYSFPSGHAQGATTFWGYLTTVVPASWFKAVAILVILAVSFSRVFLGVHYLSDVLAGMAVALVVLVAYQGVLSFGKTYTVPSGPVLPFIAGVVLPWILLLLDRTANSFKAVGFIIGVSTGYVLEESTLDYNVSAPFLTQMLKSIVGLAGVLAIRLGLGALFPDQNIFHLIRYAIMAFSVMFVFPWVFTRIFRTRRRQLKL